MNLNMDIQSINIPELIKNSQYYQHKSTIKNYEDTLQKLLTNNKNTELSNEPYAHIWEITKDLFPDFNNNISVIGKEIFGETFDNLDDRIVITGPLVRSCLIHTSENKNIKIIKELYLFRCCNEEWNDILDLSIFNDKKTEYTYEDNTKKITLIKKKFKHPAHVILQYEYLKRVGYCNGKFYASSMFFLEIQRHFTLINSKFKDPILNVPYDPLKIYCINDKNNNNLIKIIELVDIEELSKLSKKNFTKLYLNKSCLELCLEKLINTDHPVLLNQLKQMIAYLGSHVKFKRPAYLYAKLLKVNLMHPELYNYLKSIDNYYEINEITTDFNSLDEINILLLDQLSQNNNHDDFFDFLNYTKIKINKNLINMLIKNESSKILEEIINKNLVDKYLIYYLLLMSENFNLLEIIGEEFDMDLGMNYLKDILTYGKTRSFYYLYEKDFTIVDTLFEENKNLLHIIKSNDCTDLIELIIKIKPELLNLKDANKETPIIYHSKNNPHILKIFLEYEFDYTITDNEGNCFIHHLCANDCPEILKLSLKRCPELINMPNKKSETPLILCGINNLENMFYVLKGIGADMTAQDLYGNTVLHYVCSNSMCLGMIIENKQNYFGLKPSDYCKISEKYYNFI